MVPLGMKEKDRVTDSILPYGKVKKKYSKKS